MSRTLLVKLIFLMFFNLAALGGLVFFRGFSFSDAIIVITYAFSVFNACMVLGIQHDQEKQNKKF